jgi:hypothetical protein
LKNIVSLVLISHNAGVETGLVVGGSGGVEFTGGREYAVRHDHRAGVAALVELCCRYKKSVHQAK